MKLYLFLTGVATILLFSCTKSKSIQSKAEVSADVITSKVQGFLQDSLGKGCFDSLDWAGVKLTRADSGSLFYVRVPFRGQEVARAFVLLSIKPDLDVEAAGMFNITSDSIGTVGKLPAAFDFYGSVTERYLSGVVRYSRRVENGYMESIPRKTRATSMLDLEGPDDIIELPEIIIIAPGDNGDDEGASFGELLGGDFDGYSGLSSGSASLNTYGFSVANELQASRSGIDLKSYFDCFNNVPSSPSTSYSAALMVRVPVAGNPDIMWDPLESSGVGHVFIQITKTNGGSSVTQFIGFYGQGGVLHSAATVLGFDVPGRMVDNSGHPYDASLTVNLTEEQFGQLEATLIDYSMSDYNISSYNCATYAISAFNSILPQDLNPPPMAIPGEEPGDTPNGLFKLLQTMPTDGADGKVSFATNAIAGPGHGPCD